MTTDQTTNPPAEPVAAHAQQTPHSRTGRHIVIGAGATGTATANLLANTGHDVVVITRSGSGPEHESIERLQLDASDADALSSAATGAAVIYNCANPPYHRWATDWPPLAASLLHAAETSGAVLVTLSNLYGYADPLAPMQPTDALEPSTKKGAIRVQMWHDALAAHNAGRIRATEARASDFIGPGVGENGHIGDRIVPRVLKGKSASVFGSPDQPHSWTAIDDVATTLVAIGADERAWGRAWHVPSAAPMTQREVIGRIANRAGVAAPKVSSIPKVALRLGGLFVPAMRELSEMAYQFEAPFVIDAAETTDVFGIEATPIATTLDAVVEHYRQ